MSKYDLTSEEIEIIQKMRKEKEKEKENRELIIKALKTAAQYEEWLFYNGMGSSFSTFVDDFGYQDKDVRLIYQLVESIRDDIMAEVNISRE